MIKRWNITIPELTGKRERKAYVYLPTAYGRDNSTRYPVIYMFDGHNLFSDAEATFGKSWGLADYLDYTDTPVIIAAVECDTVGNGRLSEYSPVNFEWRDGDMIKGRGRIYMDWLVSTFKPYIDKNYRTLPDRANTAIGGSSMGGLMTLYALARYNKHFSKGAALSPSLWCSGEEIYDFVKQGKYRKDTVLYMSYGSLEFANHETQKKAFLSTARYLAEQDVLVTSRIVPGGTHCEACWQEEIPAFMRLLGYLPKKKY